LQEVIEIYINEEPYTGVDQWHRYDYIPYFGVVRHVKYGSLRHPIFLFTPMPCFETFGCPILELFRDIQDKRNEIIREIDRVRRLKTEPPLIINGMNVSKDQVIEDLKELYKPGGTLIIQDPQGNISPVNIIDLAALYDELEYLNSQVRYITGLHSVVLGEQQKEGQQLL